MSQVLKKGTLTEVFHSGLETTEDICKRLLQANRRGNKPVKLPKEYDNYIELFEEELFEQYIFVNGTIYEIDEVEVREIFEAKQNGNGQYEYTVKYNDCGMAHPEAIREAVESIT